MRMNNINKQIKVYSRSLDPSNFLCNLTVYQPITLFYIPLNCKFHVSSVGDFITVLHLSSQKLHEYAKYRDSINHKNLSSERHAWSLQSTCVHNFKNAECCNSDTCKRSKQNTLLPGIK